MVDTAVEVMHAESDRLIRNTFHKLRTLSKQRYHSSVLYSHHQIYDDLQLRQAALSIRARITTQDATLMYRMNSDLLYTEKGIATTIQGVWGE